MLSENTYTNIEGLVLAGGENSRFGGEIKANIILDGGPIIERSLGVLNKIFTRVSIATNNREIFSAFDEYRMIPDIHKKVGPLGGIHAGMIESDADALFVVAGDMPFLDSELIKYMVNKFLESGAEILIPRVNSFNEPLHAVYSRNIGDRLDDFLFASGHFAIRGFFIFMQGQIS